MNTVIFAALCMQPALSMPQDAQAAKDTAEVKSPTTAVIRSAILPGLGQWYNGQKIKSILVFSAGAGLIGNAIYYNQYVVRSTSDEERRFYENYRSSALWWYMGLYLLNLLDAYVDAHLWDFNTSPDLSFGEPAEDRRFMIRIGWHL